MAKKENSSKKEEQLDQGICFTIMPFGGWFDVYYRDIYCPAIKDAGLEPHRADDIYRPSAIVPDIWEYTKKAKIILADLTGRNPNVFYELGLAHALAKPAILLTESLEDVPFDLRALRIIQYDKNVPEWGSELRNLITAYMKEVLKKPNESVPVNFLKNDTAEKTSIALRQDERLLQVQSEISHLKRAFESGAYPRSREYSHARSAISSIEALEKIKEYVEIGMPPRVIVERLTKLGVPDHYIYRQLEKYNIKE